MKRFLVDKIDGNNVTLTGVEHNHLHNVLRLTEGTEVILNAGDGFDYHAKITKTTKNSTELVILNSTKNMADPRVCVTLFQALTKSDNMYLIVQKCTELGISKLVPFESKFITAKDKNGKADKLQLIANQSTKQCRRSVPLCVEQTLKFNQMVSKLKEYDLVIFANECEKTMPLNSDISIYNNIAIIVGSEGGFDKDEIDAIVSAGGKSITLGNRILRAETAAISLSAVVMYLLGEWNYEN